MLIEYAPEFTEYDTVLEQGVILNDSFQLYSMRRNGWEEYPDFSRDEDMIEGVYRGAYGVCDSLENLLDVYPELKNSDRQFVVSMTKIDQDEQDEEGGWRWHKWGDYIGTQEPTTEYIYDEPLIKRVYCFHIYEKIA